ncbi:NADPH-dependent 2,4-dienoyl-CoA reductase [Citricoccus sp. K5]|uniref:NADPH-dependent 2,4-dienoyl-CoA reductase n=1 Tax=Citricoccus sp. K5 TaxID=2653135 RepID=UPI0012F31808|nr:NADPH-dependent 2,4-dienoyl-CoA reductase [Citricoccus sp. K5]VXB37692.1 2,4-dienoyl-CoA reductase [Citricoccus sp. K5]
MTLSTQTSPGSPSSLYPHLFRPLEVLGGTLPNRIIMGSMHLGLEDRRADAAKLAAFYAERARGGVGLIVTGGYAPNLTGRLTPFAGTMRSGRDAATHRIITDAVHAEGGRIALQILHAGRYAYHPFSAAPGTSPSPITPFSPRVLSTRAVERTVGAFVRSAGYARQAGYDGVEIMGSEGYLINQFLSPRTNSRTDAWGGSAAGRRRFATETVRRIRDAAGEDFIITFRMSMVDLVPDGQTLEETLDLARELERAGVSLLNTGIGWHEARVPTIVTSVPRAAFADFTARIREAVSVPVAASNRINMPHTAEQILADGRADLVTMARPFLADPDWVLKADAGTPERINSCIGCNQACLDHTFQNKPASCLVNPRAGRETDPAFPPLPDRALLPVTPVSTGHPAPAPHRDSPPAGAVRARTTALRVAVVGAGPAGLAASTQAAARGHEVDLFEASDSIGGQFRLARQIPGKEEFAETLRYYEHRLMETGVNLRLAHRVTATELLDGGYDRILLATGVVPRTVDLPGANRPNVHAYPDVVDGRVHCGPRVAVIGAGGIGFDVSELLTEPHREGREGREYPDSGTQSDGPEPGTLVGAQPLEDWQQQWGVDPEFAGRGGLAQARPEAPARTVHLIQRKTTKMGAGLGKTTGWVHRAALKARGVDFITGAGYVRIDDDGLHLDVDGARRVLAVDDVVVCAGQVSQRELYGTLEAAGADVVLLGGADVAAELDAKRAIEQATRMAAAL